MCQTSMCTCWEEAEKFMAQLARFQASFAALRPFADGSELGPLVEVTSLSQTSAADPGRKATPISVCGARIPRPSAPHTSQLLCLFI